MIWIRARFQVTDAGHYAQCWLNFGDEDWTKSVCKFKAFSHGYEVATGGHKCYLDEMTTSGSRGAERAEFRIPQDLKKLSQYQKRMREL